MLVQQCMLLYKAHLRPPHPWEREKIGDRPSSFPSPDPSVIPTSAATAPHWQKRDQHCEERRWRLTQLEKASESMHTQSKMPHKKADNTECVKYICREECTAICSRPSTSFVPLIATVELNLRACKGQTTPNKTHNKEWQTQRVVVAEWQNLTPVPLHMLLCFLVSTSPRPWCLAHPLVCLHMWLRAWSRWRRSHSSSTQLKFLKRNCTQGVCHSSRLNCSLMTSSATSRHRLDFHHIKFYLKKIRSHSNHSFKFIRV